ncbi:Rieske 2Fe-2S domain-containing protein [Spirillospora sp. NPDC048819]|uniref:aromatic ring-hydroxylating oxygenase subunit alpha n=1 Tax=Spirillospora sp. NPDC048819 TaxID=3155268 RepID=UPI0033F7C7EB
MKTTSGPATFTPWEDIDRVDPSVYTDEAAWEDEQRVFATGWNFLAHESEIPNPGDFVVRYILRDSIIVCRGKDGVVRAFFNVCRHRGMQVCRAEIGNTKRFTCPYHGWLYDTTGRLTSLPLERPFFAADGLDRERYSLRELPVMEIIEGFVFGSLDPGVAALEAFLGDYLWYLRIHTRRDPAGLEVIGEPQRWLVQANWKIGAENFMGDSYHAQYTHRSVFEIGLHPNTASDFKGTGRRNGVHVNAGPGTMAFARQSAAERGYPDPMTTMFERSLPAEQARLLLHDGPYWPTRGHLFPNLSLLNAGARTSEDNLVPFLNLRLWRPLSAGVTEVWSWVLVERSASAEFKELSARAYTLTFGTTGTEEQDDVENFTSMQRGLYGRASTAIDQVLVMGRGVDQTHTAVDWSGPGHAVGTTYTDSGNRYFHYLYRQARRVDEQPG